ncbi:paired immunoglobulin-like type 2 receptor beta isoform X3 [Eptesicus fuscus]|uniref:paired immunoglobulin-like type 2 receptor beta isoform X3 n=1 Tax=Eptesicus fuscus TaxID=29078 RepID=UPI002404332C|nr:paired immunoglobulin-like type 2 receptor beta isoform X3 [Eptesicus fuscus]
MGLPLLLPLLLAASLQAGGSAECILNPDLGLYQPERLSAPEGGSIDIPFSFCLSWELATDPNVRIYWRWKDFHGEFIYNTTPPFTHEDFKNRLSLNWAKGQTNGSLRISNLRREDQTTEKTTTDPTSTTTTDGLSVSGDKGRSGFWPLSKEVVVSMAVASTVLKIAILGLMVYLRWKRSQGL